MVSLFPLLLLVTLGACAAASGAAVSAAVPRDTSAGGQFLEKEHRSAHGSRRYRVYLPARYDGSASLPLVVMLHGCTQDAEDFARGTRMNALAEEHDFLVVYPEQPPSAQPQKCWNWYEPAHQERDAGEPALIAGITREVMREYRVDSARTFVAGISAGGAMSIIMAATYPDLYAAVASHSGIAYGLAKNQQEALALMRGEPPNVAEPAVLVQQAMGERRRVIPLLLLQGSDDPVVNPVNAEHLARQWAAAFTNGHGGSVVQTLLLERLGHAWSGGSPEGTFTDPRGPDASREIVRFFLAHHRAP